MDIKLIRLKSTLHKNPSLIKEGNNFISLINDELFDDDLLLKEKAKNALFDVVFVESGGTEEQFLKIFKKLSSPIILISNSKNNSLPACFEIKSYIETHKKEVMLLTGEEEDIALFLKNFAKLITAKKEIADTNLGLIGKESDWLIASKIDSKLIKTTLNLNVINISMEELYSEIEKRKFEKVPHLNSLQKKVNNKQDLELSLFVYGALKRLIEKYNLKALSIRCFDLISKYKCTACLALALLNEEGIVSGCEGDIPSLITMYLIKAISGKTSFQANPSRIDYKNNQLLLAHCTLPLNMVKEYSLPTHFESDLGIGISGKLEKKICTVIKICPDLKKVLCFPSEIIDSPSLNTYCRTQALLKVNEDCFYQLFSNNFGNHLILVYDDISNLFLSFFEILNIK